MLSPEPVYDRAFIESGLQKGQKYAIPSFNPSGQTTTYLQFFKELPQSEHEKPYVSKIPPPQEEQRQINFGGCYEKVFIFDVRGNESLFTLDRDGFAFQKHTSLLAKEGDFHKEAYIQEMSVWLQKFLDCNEVVVFDFTVRSQERNTNSDIHHAVDIARRVHCGKQNYRLGIVHRR